MHFRTLLFSLFFTLTGCDLFKATTATIEKKPDTDKSPMAASENVTSQEKERIEELDPPAIYTTYCISCHGPEGKGDGPQATAMKVKPRDLTDPEWHKKTPNEDIAKVIQGGGPAHGLSPEMPAWGQTFDKQLPGLVAYIRGFERKPAR